MSIDLPRQHVKLKEITVVNINTAESQNKTNDNITIKYTKPRVVDVKTMKCTLSSISNNDIFKSLMISMVYRYNKISLEAIYLFNIYILHLCNNNLLDNNINTNTIRTCARILIEGARGYRTNPNDDSNKKEYELLTFIKNNYFNFDTTNRNGIFINDIESLGKPLDYVADEYITNLTNHINMNFLKFQRRYIITLLTNEFNGILTKTDIKFIIYAIQTRINGSDDYVYKVEKRAIKLNKIFNKSLEKLNLFIKREQILLKSIIKDEIIIENKNIKIDNDYKLYYLKYFCVILNALTKQGVKGFTIVPQYIPKIRFITFDARSLAGIYNKYLKEQCEETVNIKTFESNFKSVYMDKLFNINKKFKRILKHYPALRSISTNGYEVALSFCILDYTRKEKLSDEEKVYKKEENKDKKKISFDLEAEITKKTTKIKCGEKEIIVTNPTLFDAKQLKSNNDYLNKFDIVGIDVGNKSVFDITTESGKHFNVTKHYINDLSHNNSNNIKLKKHMDKYNIKNIYEQLSSYTVKTTCINTYMKYVEMIRTYWDDIFTYITSKQIFRLNFDKYVYRQKALSRVAKEIIAEIKSKENVYNKYKKYFSNEIHTNNKDKPILIALGAGNGSGTITNTKGCSPKGPISKLIHELSKYCVVIMTPEHNTSQLCSSCGNYLEDVNCYHYPSKNKINKELEKVDDNEKIKLKEEINKNTLIVKNETKKINKLKKIKHQLKVINLPEKDNNTITKRLTKKLEELEENVFQTGYYRKSYRLRRCANKHDFNSNRCVLWERNVNASINIRKALIEILTLGSAKSFGKTRAEKPKKTAKTKILTINSQRTVEEIKERELNISLINNTEDID